MAAKKKTGPKRKKQDVVEEVTEVEVVSEDELPQAKSDGDDVEDVSEEERPKSKGKAKPASKKRGGKTRPAESDEEVEVEPPPKKGRGRPSNRSGKTSPEVEDEEDVENGGGAPKASASTKKGRGRPKRSGKPEIVEDVDNVDGEESEEEQPLAKKGKGKSKKAGNVSPDLVEDEEEDQPPSKKSKGGRPKKDDKRKSATSAKDSKKGKRGRPSSSKQSDEDSGAEEEEREYEVDKILEVQFLRNGKREFLIKWKGYSREDSTWEPEDHLDCKELLEAFMAKVEDDHISRPRRLSRRPTTIHATRISESRNVDLLNRVKDGRIDKTIKRSSVSSTRSTRSLGNVQNISRFNQNGRMLSSVSENVNVRRNKQRSTKRGILRAAVLSCGMVASLSAALMYSSNASLSWDNISLQAQQLIIGLRDKFEVYYQQSQSGL